MAALFLGLQALALVGFGDAEHAYLFYWYCNNVLICIAIAFCMGNMQLAKGLSYVGMLTQLYWVLDFCAHVLGLRVSGATSYIFTDPYTLATIVTVIIHLVAPIAVLLYTARVKPQPVSLIYAWIYALLLFVVTIAATVSGRDINCVFSACNPSAWYGYWDPYLWPAGLIVMTSVAYALHCGLYRILSKVKY